VNLSLSIVGLALLVSLLTGVVSGFLPAWRAARMNPVDALRNE
jgi:putative ABC transport system permease protein